MRVLKIATALNFLFSIILLLNIFPHFVTFNYTDDSVPFIVEVKAIAEVLFTRSPCP